MRLLWAAVAMGAAGPAWAQAPSNPCETPEHHAFDFWVGDWEVFTPDGRQAGTNSIRKTMTGCVLHETYDGSGGFHGESFNVYDAPRGVWHQSWVDNTGLLLVLEGGIHDGAMVLTGRAPGGSGEEVRHRITWTPLGQEGTRVRQHWEQSLDGGHSWSTVFDGEYRRRVPPTGGTEGA